MSQKQENEAAVEVGRLIAEWLPFEASRAAVAVVLSPGEAAALCAYITALDRERAVEAAPTAHVCVAQTVVKLQEQTMREALELLTAGHSQAARDMLLSALPGALEGA